MAGNFVPDETKLAECGGRDSCLEQAFGSIAFREGARSALSLFEDRIATDPAVERNCHRIVHTIGSAVFARNDGNVAETFAGGSPICASGFYHGILERAFVGLTTKTELGRAARSLCVGADLRRRSFVDYQCRHGLGHGLMIQTGFDLPTALSICTDLGTGWDEVTCTGGVFMENVSTRFGFRSRWLDDEDPLYPCMAVAVKYRRSCHVRAVTWILELNHHDFARAARTCASAGRRWAPYCFRGFGRDVVSEAKYADMQKALRLCRYAGRYEGACLYGAARTFSDGTGLRGVRQAARFCARAPAALRDSCVSGFGLVIGLLYATDAARRGACATIAPKQVRACSAAAMGAVEPSGATAWG